ncbi:unnamed protein product [Ectocarpus sp. CCAP 1310/34]|nr:unnamed protein product [Ectocarpus sp. CCAP 1310/34]
MAGLSLMSGPNWPVRRYEIIVKKGGAPLGLKLHQTKSTRGVYANGFAEGPYPPPGPQACMRVGDVLVSVDGKSVEGATLPVALAAIETARRRDRLRDFITAKQDDPRKGNVVMVFERVSPRLTFRDVALDPRKVVYLLNYMLEVRCAGTGGVGGSSSSSGGGDGKKEAVIISLDEARLMFWLEVQVLFEMSAVMAPSRDDMSKVYDKFFRPGSGFYVHELTDTRQAKIRTRRSWDGDVSGLPSVGRVARPDPSAKTAKEVAQPQDAASSGSGSEGVASTASTDSAVSVSPGVGGGEGLGASTTASAAPGDGQEGKGGGGGGGGGNIKAGEPPSSADPPPAPAARSSTEGGGSDVLAKHGAEAGENGTREGSGGRKAAAGAEDWVSLPVEFLAADLSKIFRASQEKVEETLTAGCFYRFKTSPWKGRMVAHLSNSPDFVHVPFERIMAEQELRDVMMLHMIVTQTPGWLQVWKEIELTVKPRMALLQTRRSVRQRRGSALSSRGSGVSVWLYFMIHGGVNEEREAIIEAGTLGTQRSSIRVGTSTPSFSPPSPDMRELKAAAAVAIVASAVYLWDFFLSADSHASLGVARDTNAYGTLKQLLAENVPGDKMGGCGAGDASSGDGPGTQKGRDAGDDYAVSVGKALLDMQRHVLRKAAWGKATPGNKGIRWDKVVERVWKEIGDEEETLDTKGFGGFKKKVKEMLESREEATLRKKVRSEDHLEIYGKLKEGIGMKSYLDGPMDYAKKLKLQFRVGDLDLPERRKRYSSRRREEEEDRQTCPCGKSEEIRPHIVGECELYRKEREDLEEDMRQRGCDMDKFGKLDNSEKIIAVIGDRWWAQEAVEDGGIRCARNFYVVCGRNVKSSQMLVLCASVYPDFQASSSHEHLCAELTTGTRSPARLPPGPPDELDFDPPPSQQQQRDSIGGGAPLPPPPQGPTPAVRRGTSAAVSPPRQARAPPPLRQKMLLHQQQQQQQQRQQGGSSEVGAGEKAGSASPFAFLGGGTPPSDGERKVITAGNSHARRSSAPGVSPTGVASRGAGVGGKNGPGRVDPFQSEDDAPRVSDRAGRVQGVSGPQFEPLWRASRGWVLEKVMRRVELPPHVSRHRPPLDKACQQGRRGGKGAVGSGTSSSGTAPPDLRQHLSLPRTARRLGRRPNHSSGSLVPGEPTEEADSSAGVGGSTQGGGGGVAGDLDVASPPDVLGSRSGFGVQETQGIEPGPTGDRAREDGGGGVVGEGIRGCAEWAVSFSGSLRQGIMTVQVWGGHEARGRCTEHAVCVAPRNLGLDVLPEGLEAFYCPGLPASGEAPRACPPPSGGKSSSGVGKGGRGSGSSRGGCFGPGVPPPPPRLFTFAAPGRSGTGTFYGACLSVFRPVSQWVGGEPAADVAARGTNRGSSNSPPPCPIATAATVTATTATAPDTQAPLVEEESKTRIEGIVGASSSRTETASHVDAGAATAASVGEARAPARLSGVGDVSGVVDGEVQTVDDGAQGNMGDNKAPSEEGAIEKEDLGKLSADGGVSSTAVRETDSGVVEDAVLDDATEAREAAVVGAAATAQQKKEAANTTTLDKTPSMLEMLKLKKGMGIFGRSSSVGQNKVSPSPTSTAPMSSLPPSVTKTEVAPESDTEELRVEVDGQGADEATGGLEGSGGTGAVAKTKTTAAAAASPSMMDLSSRFRLGMGMFGSGKASPRVVTGSGFSRKLGTQAAAATAAAAAATTSPAAGSAPVEASPTPSSSSGGVGKFSSYARRAGNFLGSDSRGVGRSPRPTQPPPSPDVLPNGPPPPSPLVPVYLSSPPPEAETDDAVLRHGDATATAVAVAAGAVDVATDGNSRQLSDSAASEGGGRNKHKRSLSDVPSADAASAAAAAVVDANELASAASSGVGDASKGRSMCAESSGVGSSSSSSSSSGSGSGTRRQGESADGSGGRQKHTFFVASGVCLLSTRPEIGAMRRALAAYWAAHGDDILARGSATEGGAAAAHAGGERRALAARESGGGGSADHGRSGSDGEVTEAPSEGSGEAEDEQEQEENKDVGAWTEMDPSTLRAVLVPFVTRERREEKDRESQAHHNDKERRRSAGAAQERTSAADVLTKSFSAGSLRHSGQSGGATNGQGDRAEAGETAECGVDMSAVAHKDGSGFGLDFDPSAVFRCLSPRNLCLVMLALLCERKVVLVSSRLSLLTQAGEVFRSLLQPLSWSHVYVPLLPRKMAADLLQCPTPFILGLESVTARELDLPRDAIQVHLDTDYLCVPKDFLGLAPMSVVCSRISSVLNPGVDDLDCPSNGGAGADAGGVWAAGTARTIRFLFREFISELLQGATESTFRVGQGPTATILLDEHLYKRAKASAAKTAERFYDEQRRSSGGRVGGHGLHENQYPGPLYNRHCGLLLDQFVKTQMLSHFLSEGGSE